MVTGCQSLTFLPDFIFCVPQKKEMYRDLEGHDGEEIIMTEFSFLGFIFLHLEKKSS